MAVTKLQLLSTGRCAVAAWMLDTRHHDTSLVSLPVWSYLIETTDGPILVDTGMPDECVNRPNLFETPGEEPSIVPYMSDDDRIVSVLARAGYQPKDLVCLVSTHAHFDHAGGNRHFTDTEVVMQQVEYDAVIPQLDTDGAHDFWSSKDLKYRLINGDYELAPGVQLLFTPGHSVGHQSVMVKTPKTDNVLLTIDAAYHRANYEDGVPFAGANAEQAAASVEKLKAIAKSEGAFVFYGHDIVQEKSVKLYPDFY